jgi:hypothetical protein
MRVKGGRKRASPSRWEKKKDAKDIHRGKTRQVKDTIDSNQIASLSLSRSFSCATP